MANEFRDSQFKDTFNYDYLLHIQALGRPDGSRDMTLYTKGSKDQKVKGVESASEITAITEGMDEEKPAGIVKLMDSFRAKAGMPVSKQANDAQKKAWERVVAMSSLIWTPRAMHGAEYERGGFEACVAARALEGDMVFDTIDDLAIRTEVFPDQETMNRLKYDGIAKTLKKSWQDKAKISVPEDVETGVYIIAPRKNLAAAKDMLRFKFGFADQEIDTHRGFGLREAALYQSLSEDQQEKVADAITAYNDVGWFEIFSGVFITTDKEMFEKAKIMFDASDAKQKPEAPTIFDQIKQFKPW